MTSYEPISPALPPVGRVAPGPNGCPPRFLPEPSFRSPFDNVKPYIVGSGANMSECPERPASRHSKLVVCIAVGAMFMATYLFNEQDQPASAAEPSVVELAEPNPSPLTLEACQAYVEAVASLDDGANTTSLDCSSIAATEVSQPENQQTQPSSETAISDIEMLQTAVEMASNVYDWDENKTILIQTLIANGIPLAGTSGIGGNVQVESGFDPGIVERGNGIGFGFCQWSFDRRTSMEQEAARQGVPASDPTFQANYIIFELENRDQRYDSSKSEMEGIVVAETPEEAAVSFNLNFERPRAEDANSDMRVRTAREIYDQIWGQLDIVRAEMVA